MAAIDCSEQPYIVLIFLYAGPSGILDSDGRRIPLYLGASELLHFPLVLMNRLKKAESVVFLNCRFSLFLKDLFFPEYLVFKFTAFLSWRTDQRTSSDKAYIFPS